MKNPLKLIDRHGLMILLGLAALITLVSIIAIVLSVSLRTKRAVTSERERRIVERQILDNDASFDIEDFFRDIRNPQDGVTYSARLKRRVWTQDEIDSYWIDTDDVGITTLLSDNDKRIRDSLNPLDTGDSP